MLEDLDLLPDGSESSSEEELEDEDEEEGEEEDEDEEVGDAGEKGVIAAPAPRATPSTSTVVVPPSRGVGNVSRAYRHGTVGGIPWFEEMIEGSRLGRVMKGRRGMGVSDDNNTTIEWEVSEWSSGDTGLAQAGSRASRSSGKRKRGPTNEQPNKRTESP